MSDCCTQNAPINGCRQGRDCPVNAARAARTCEALGICQHPSRECAGACEQVPRLPEFDPEAMTLLHWANVAAIGLISLIVICCFVGYLYARHQS